MLKRVFFSLFLLYSVFSCKTKKMEVEKKKDITFKENTVIKKEVYNFDKTMVLVMEYTATKEPFKTINYQVLDSKNKEVKKKDTFLGTKMEWYTNNSLKAYIYRGTVKKDDTSLLDSKDNENDNFKIITIN